MARAATSPELTLYRTSGKASKLYAAILKPPTIYTARINQTFTDTDQTLVIIYDGGSGTLANVLPDMEVWIGSSAGSYDKGICRLRDKDATHFYLSETSEIDFADNDYVTIVANFTVWARPVRITEDGTAYMDEITYTNQHTNWDPMPNMGPHRVKRLTGSSVTTTWNASTSFCPGSSISSYAWSCSSASASSGTTTATPTFSFNTTGWHIVYLTVTAANGESFFGVRYVYVWNLLNPPSLAEITDPGKCDVDSGGWSIGLTLRSGVTLSDVYERALVILFTEDFYGGTESEIGPYTDAENIVFVGWISEEENVMESEQGSVTFTANGAAFWMGKIPSWPDGVEYVAETPADWVSVANLTVDLGVYHFLRWRSTITRICDVTLTGDTKITQEVSSSSQNLWGQIQEMTWAQIYARPGFNALNQLFIAVHPNLIPTGDRTFPTVMTLTKEDYEDGVSFTRDTVDEVSIVDMSGVIVTAPNTATAKFALAPGHSLPHYGDWDLQTNLLLSSQNQVITLAGLYRAWRNNKFKSIPISLVAAIRLIDCFPNQKCNITLSTSDNVRGFAYSGGLIPTEVTLNHDPNTGHFRMDVNFEAETSEGEATQGDTPGSNDTDNPPDPSFPPIPIPPISLPGIPPLSEGGPGVVVVHDATYGLIFTNNFNGGSPTWALCNGGLTGFKLTQPTHMFVTPNGALWLACLSKMSNAQRGTNYQFAPWVARAPSIGGTFTILKDEDTLWTDYPATTNSHGICGIGYNPLSPETVTIIQGEDTGLDSSNFHIWTCTDGATFSQGAAIPRVDEQHAKSRITFGQNTWMYVTNRDELGTNGAFWRINAAASSVLTAGSPNWDIGESEHIRAGTNGIMFVSSTSGLTRIRKSIDNGITWSLLTSGVVNQGDCDPSGQYLMSAYNNKSRSADGAGSWSSIPNLPAGGAYYFKYAGGSGFQTRWIAARGIIRLSLNWGESWLNKEGNISSAAPILDINMIHVVSV